MPPRQARGQPPRPYYPQVLYLATLSCLQHNPRIRAHYDRLIQRADRQLPKMQAIGACMNKLLLYAFAVMS